MNNAQLFPITDPLISSNSRSSSFRATRHNYSEDFQALWAAYPKRAGGNPKLKAWKYYHRRLKAGYTHSEMFAGVLRYAAYCEATKITNTPFVQQASTFLNVDESFLEEWQTPAQQTGVPVGDEDLVAWGTARGIAPRPGESFKDYRVRLNRSAP